MGIFKWSEIPVPVRWYVGLLLCLGLIPIGFSLFYPLDKLNALLEAKITAVPPVMAEANAPLMATKPVADVVPIPKTVSEAIAATPTPTPVVRSSEKTDWVGIIGGVNSAIMAWIMYFDRRRRNRNNDDEDDNPNKPEKPGQITPKSDNNCDDDISG